MPRMYRRRGGFRRRGRRTRKGGFSFGNALSLAKRAYSGYRYLKSMVNVERKFCDVNYSSQVIGKSLAVYQLNTIAEGSDYNQRTGISVKSSSLLLRFSVHLDPAATYNQVRLILFEDCENQGSAPTGTDILESSTNYLSPLQHSHGQRWKVLRDKIITLDVNGKAVVDLRMFMKMASHYKYSGVNAGDTYNCALYLGIISDNNTNSPVVDFYSRLRFVDN